METKEKKQTGHKMTKVQRVIVIVTAVVLATILIVVASTQYMGSAVTYFVSTPTESEATNEPTEDTQKDVAHTIDPDTDEDASINTDISDAGITEEDNEGASNEGQEGNGGQFGNLDQSGGHNNSAVQGGDSTEVPSEDDTGSDTDQSDGENNDSSDGDTDTPSNENNQEDGGVDTDITQGGIQTNDTVTICAIGEYAVTVKVGSETIVIPVQTTSFNGRITKSGVISDSLCGYFIGASVMLYYLENNSLDGVTLTGAYVKVDSTRLTVSGDYNGDGSKIVFRINGVRLP